MNIYLIQEDGEATCFQATCMQNAITIATQKFCKENYDSDWDIDETPDNYYQRAILQSCSLIGELANP